MTRAGITTNPGWDAIICYFYPAYQSTDFNPIILKDSSPSLVTSQVSLTVRRYPFILLGGEMRCESKVSCPRTQHNGQARARTRTSRSGVKRANPARPPRLPLVLYAVLLLKSRVCLATKTGCKRYGILEGNFRDATYPVY